MCIVKVYDLRQLLVISSRAPFVHLFLDDFMIAYFLESVSTYFGRCFAYSYVHRDHSGNFRQAWTNHGQPMYHPLNSMPNPSQPMESRNHSLSMENPWTTKWPFQLAATGLSDILCPACGKIYLMSLESHLYTCWFETSENITIFAKSLHGNQFVLSRADRG